MQTSLNKRILLPLLASIVAITPLAIDLYLPAMLQIANDLGTSISQVQLSLSTYLAGYALGMLFFGPLADQFGRRKLAIIGLSGFCFFTLILVFCRNIELFLLSRGLQAFFGAAATVVVPGIIRHIYEHETAKGMSYVSMIMMMAPLLAPSIGSALMLIWHWQSIFIFLSGYSIIILLLVMRYLIDIPITKNPNKGLNLFINSYKTVLSYRPARFDILSSMFASFAFFCFLTSVPFIYLDYFKVESQTFGILFAFNVIALMAGNFLNTRLVGRFGSRTMLYSGLVLAILSASCLVVASLMHSSLVWVVVFIAPLMMSLGLMASNADALILIAFAKQSGTATAVIGTLRFGSGALAGPLLALLHSHDTFAFSILMFSAVVAILLCQWLQHLQNKAV
ncbi:multidrug effflux MFS transporter [Pseudoalteromonas tunicata]|uniref:multidrug effflux MFS transporter n=1 Tax=Pseudoalteromonas tunicata TaxID=314281 RepID=UPI00273EEF38|nr:multidrug effflux MFS transporter [Pseudoalteromonas tunicata]MDP4982372.1 multidrug effflux MFS transporter [Pseudoalteromonas tunicata]MDP5213151.1 multidrug effflux MFS transporter [Pseudoalteromonas tunicata]